MANGILSSPGDADMRRNIASMADFHDMKALDISGGDDTVIETEYGDGWELKEILNNTAAAGDVIVSTIQTPGTDITLKLNAYCRSGRLPSIYYIKKAGTMDGLVLFLQKR